MVFALASVAYADDATEFYSPTPEEVYSIEVTYEPSDGSIGDASADNYQVIKNTDGTVTLTATPKNGGKFTEWKIDGEYEVVDGSLDSPTITIRPKSDIKAEAVFVIDGTVAPTTPSGTTAPTTAPKPNNGSTSPKTGDPLFLIISLAALALGVGVFAVKKIKE